MNKKLLPLLLLLPILSQAQNEDEPTKGKFRQENIFIGTALNLGFSTGVFQIGANPEIGYSVTNWLDAGISTNINYTSFRYSSYSDRVLNYGGGTFVRIWPVRFLFLTAVPEYNWIKITRKYPNGTPSISEKFNASSVLLGAGYGNRIIGQTYSYFAIMFDASRNINSPYRDELNRALPVLRAGFAIYLKPKREREN
ncbi:MAG: hypothetical protein SFU20_02075 [Chitinophagaceae bacterium]|nr:hypothetical protein [Chitinophagaceae bacterium]